MTVDQEPADPGRCWVVRDGKGQMLDEEWEPHYAREGKALSAMADDLFDPHLTAADRQVVQLPQPCTVFTCAVCQEDLGEAEGSRFPRLSWALVAADSYEWETNGREWFCQNDADGRSDLIHRPTPDRDEEGKLL